MTDLAALADRIERAEAERIAFWLIEDRDIDYIADTSFWRVIPWAFLHPVRFNIAVERTRLAKAIYLCEHRAQPSPPSTKD